MFYFYFWGLFSLKPHLPILYLYYYTCILYSRRNFSSHLLFRSIFFNCQTICSSRANYYGNIKECQRHDDDFVVDGDDGDDDGGGDYAGDDGCVHNFDAGLQSYTTPVLSLTNSNGFPLNSRQ